MEPLRVAFVSVVPSPYQRDLFAALARRPELDLQVFYMEAAAPDSPWPTKPLQPYETILAGGWFPIGSARCHVNWKLPDLKKFDLLVINTLMSITAQCLMRSALRSHTPWIFWGERQRPRGGGWRQHVHDFLCAPLHRAAGIAGIGTLAQRDYAQRFPEPQHFCIPYFCDLDPFLEEPREPRKGNETVFLFCGQMIARKGVDLLLAAFAQVSQTLLNAKLLLVGREAELPKLLAPLAPKVRAQIQYAGFQPPEKLPEFFARADVFVLPSRYDGWGVVVNQAVGAGLPVICSDAVGAGFDLVEEGVNGLKFPSGDVAELARALEAFAGEPTRAASWGAASRARAAEWSPSKGAEKWLNAINAVLT